MRLTLERIKKPALRKEDGCHSRGTTSIYRILAKATLSSTVKITILSRYNGRTSRRSLLGFPFQCAALKMYSAMQNSCASHQPATFLKFLASLLVLGHRFLMALLIMVLLKSLCDLSADLMHRFPQYLIW